jgi:hypothetical protein
MARRRPTTGWCSSGRCAGCRCAVLVLRHFEDLPESEVARVLGLPLGTVKSLNRRGLALLRQAPDVVAMLPSTTEVIATEMRSPGA